jgi:hypothetical protein
MWTRQMTLNDYRIFLQEMMDLQMWYVTQVVLMERLSFAATINGRTEAYAYSMYFDPQIAAEKNKAWIHVVERLEHLFWTEENNGFVSKSWEILQTLFEPRMSEDLDKAQAMIASSFAGFTYEFHSKYFGPSEPKWLTLHFRNYFAPNSPFSHRKELIKGLLSLIEDAQFKRSDIQNVQCASWLNNLEPFYSLFPKTWYETSVVCPLEGHTGWWGQFIDRQGNFHRKKAEIFRKTLKFECPNRMGTCDLAELKDFLSQMYNVDHYRL